MLVYRSAEYPPQDCLRAWTRSGSCFIDWVGWRSLRGEVGGGAYKSATGNPLFLLQNECDSSLFDHQSILMMDHFTGTAKFVGNFTFLNNGCL